MTKQALGIQRTLSEIEKRKNTRQMGTISKERGKG